MIVRGHEANPNTPGRLTWYMSPATALFLSLCWFSPSGTLCILWFRLRSKEKRKTLTAIQWGFERTPFETIRSYERDLGAALARIRTDAAAS